MSNILNTLHPYVVIFFLVLSGCASTTATKAPAVVLSETVEIAAPPEATPTDEDDDCGDFCSGCWGLLGVDDDSGN